MSDEEARPGSSGRTADADTPVAEDEAQDRSERRGHGATVTLLLVVLVFAAGAWYWVARVHEPLHEVLSSRVDALDSERAKLAARLNAGDERGAEVTAAQQGLSASLDALERAQQTLEESVNALYAKESSAPLAWVLAEAEYLVMAATQRLALEHDIDTAIAALEAADTRLRAAQHPELIEVREQLARDIAALEAVNQPDIEGLAIWLAEAVGRVGELPTKPIADLDMSFSRMRDEAAQPENWRGVAKAMWTDLVSLIEIKDGELPDGVLFDPELRYFLQQNLRLELASARLAVLRRDNANFRAASTLVTDLLAQYYDTSDAAVASIVTRLGEAREMDLDPEIPAISASLDTVRAKRVSLSASAAPRGVAAAGR